MAMTSTATADKLKKGNLKSVSGGTPPDKDAFPFPVIKFPFKCQFCHTKWQMAIERSGPVPNIQCPSCKRSFKLTIGIDGSVSTEPIEEA